jgi:ABC-type transport system involved in cytochrome bd biosynthesis fused ATPase/permease subunit
VAGPADIAQLDARVLKQWRTRLLHGDWRLWDLEFFQVLVATISVLTTLVASVLVVAMTRTDGTVRVSVLFVAFVLASLVAVRGAARAGLSSAERRAAATASLEARRVFLDAVGHGAPVSAGSASSFVGRSADDIGAYVARAVPARTVGAVVPVLVLVVVALIDPLSALIAGCVLVVAPFAMVRIGRRSTREAEVGIGRLRSLSTRALELLDGAVELRALGAMTQGRAELAGATNRAVESTRRSLRIGLQSATALDVLAGTAIGLVAMVDGFRLLDGSVSLGHALAAVLLTAEVFAPLRAAGAAFHAGADGRAAIRVLDTVAGAASDVSDSPGSLLPRVAASPAAVSVRHASIAPSASASPIIEDLSFFVGPGGSLVLAGPSGSGKTTVLRAIAGALPAARGAILVGNSDPTRFSARQRCALLAAVDQRPCLVAGTLRDNLVLGLGAVDDEALNGAIERCGLMPLVERAAGGLGAQVGEEGRLLSAGERTRVALCRAVLRDPGVLLLDEVGAHLDDASLVALRHSLSEFLSTRTVIEVAHDRTLQADAPRIDLGLMAGTR